jgi:hypothetical protein
VRALATAVTCGVFVFAVACTGTIGEAPIEEDNPSLDATFSAAAVEFEVPVSLLKSVSYVETEWHMVVGHDHDHHGMPAAFGVMALRGDRIDSGAALLGVDPDDVRYDLETNIRAGAALLSQKADELGIDRLDLDDWALAVGEWSGIEDDDGRRNYVVSEVYGVLRAGATMQVEGGHVVATIDATEVNPNYPPPPLLEAGTADYPSAIWRPSPNNSARSSGSIGRVAMVIIHTCEGSYSGCWSWLRNSAAGASAHYVVSKGGETTQLVREARKAWHIAASYQCSRNGNHECWRNGYNSNNFTIGIEHAGYASQGSFPNAQLEASAKLVCDITRDHGISVDNVRIVGHGKLQPYNRTDPGPNWPWAHYRNRIRAHCGSGGGGGGGGGGGSGGGSSSEIIVDSNNARNDASKARVEVSSSWVASASTPGYFGTGYWWSSTKAVSDGATFWFYLPANATKSVDAWWTAGGNRSTSAPFVAFNAAGNVVGRAHKNEQANGKRWNNLGRWAFTKGWNKIVVSRWSGASGVVIADAIRVR